MGGAALNSARCAAFARKLLGNGEGVDYFGGVGVDERGAQLEKMSLEAGVTVNFDKKQDVETGACAVLVKGQDRTLCANISAAGKYDKAHLEANMAVLEQAKYLYTTGFFITSNFEALMHMAKYCNDNNKPMCFNFSAPFLCDFFNDQVEKALECADYVFCNEDEAASFGKKHELDGTDLKEVCKKMATWPKTNTQRPRVAVVTYGAKPVIVVQHSAEGTTLNEYPVPQLSAEQVVDTNGCGDAFVGAFLASQVAGKSLEESI